MSATSERLALTAREVGVLRPGSVIRYGWRGERHGWWLFTVDAGTADWADAWTGEWLGRSENAAHEALRRLARDKEAR